jgi:hypothetical protein
MLSSASRDCGHLEQIGAHTRVKTSAALLAHRGPAAPRAVWRRRRVPPASRSAMAILPSASASRRLHLWPGR